MKIKDLLIFIAIPLGIGIISSLLSGNQAIYSEVTTPPLSPPGILFPIVWTILYVLMGISSYIIYNEDSSVLPIYFLQLFFNFIWSPLFFRFELYLLSFIIIMALIGLVAIMIYRFYRVNKFAGILQIPYLIWLLFAAYLNLGIYILN